MSSPTAPQNTEAGTTRGTFTGTTTKRTLPWARIIDVAAMSVLLAMGVVAFGPVFSDSSGYVAAGGGALLGGAVAVIAAWRKWSGFVVASVALVVFVLCGGALALPGTTIGGVVPTLETVNRLVLLTYQAWRDLLTVSVPASSFTGPAVVPYLSGLLCSLLAVSIALRARHHLWALAPAALLLLVGILWGTKVAPAAPLQGGVFCLTALAWASWRVALRQHRDNAHLLTSVRTNTAAQRQRAGAAGVILLVAGGLAVSLGGGLANATDRYVLRDDVVPPLDLRAYASPLTKYRYFEVQQKKKTLFTVTGLPEGGRVRLAALDGYDGHVYSVDAASAKFLRVGDRIGVEDTTTDADDVRIEIGDYSGVWVPGGGDVTAVEFTGAQAENVAAGLHYNADSGTLLTTAGLRPGQEYVVSIVPPDAVSDEALAKDSIASQRFAADVEVPEFLASMSSDFIEPGESQIDQLRQLESKFREIGFYSNDNDVATAGHNAGRLAKMFEPKLVGDDEQYAVAMALMIRQLGYPARVVMGFYPEEPATTSSLAITGFDAHVWVEVPFEKAGWIAFDPTPDRDKTPDTKVPKPDEVPQPQVLPPPVPPDEPIDPPDDRTDDSKTTQKEDPGIDLPGSIRVALLAAGGGAVLAAPLVLIALLKSRRRTKRRRTGRAADRISGGWAEVLDTATDLGTSTPERLTRQETARDLAAAFPEAGSVAVAQRVDAHVFGELDPEPADVDAMWAQVDELLSSMRGSVHPVRRVLARFSLRSLLSRRSARRTM